MILFKKGYTQRDIHRKTGISQSALSLYATGRMQPSQNHARRIARALDVTIGEIWPALFSE
jgi:transcriptional regulator with XRE-family HTH domain